MGYLCDMNFNKKIHVASYSSDGQLQGHSETQVDDSAVALVEHFIEKFTRLPGDLDLPLEEKIPGMNESAVLRICSESSAAYVIYYFNDAPLLASLLVAGQDEEAEFEIMSTLKFLLLQGDGDEELEEETIDAVLAAAEFDFEAIEDRPITYQIVLDDDPEVADQVRAFRPIDHAVAAAFISRSTS